MRPKLTDEEKAILLWWLSRPQSRRAVQHAGDIRNRRAARFAALPGSLASRAQRMARTSLAAMGIAAAPERFSESRDSASAPKRGDKRTTDDDGPSAPTDAEFLGIDAWIGAIARDVGRTVAEELSESIAAAKDQTLAATEAMIRAANAAAVLVALELGLYNHWITEKDDGVCTVCRRYEANGPYPPASCPQPIRDSHPRCRCVLVPAPHSARFPMPAHSYAAVAIKLPPVF